MLNQDISNFEGTEETKYAARNIESGSAEEGQVNGTKFIFKNIYEIIELIISAICLTLFFSSFLFSTSDVRGSSMLPTLEDKDKLLVLINNGLFGKIKKGDVVVVNQPWSLRHSIIKRVIAEEGDKVDINFLTGEVRINDVLQKEDYINSPTYLSEGVEFPVVVPKGFVFVMGDNRNASTDSRSCEIGMIDKRYLHGKAKFIYMPLKHFGRFK